MLYFITPRVFLLEIIWKIKPNHLFLRTYCPISNAPVAAELGYDLKEK